MSEPKKLAFDVARQQLASQKEDLRNLRNQASFSAAVAGLVASVFAGLTGSETLLQSSNLISFLGLRFEIWIVAATLFFALVYSGLVISGWKKCTFDLSPEWILSEDEDGKTEEEILTQLARDLESYFDANEEVIKDTKASLVVSLVLTLFQIPAWLLLIS